MAAKAPAVVSSKQIVAGIVTGVVMSLGVAGVGLWLLQSYVDPMRSGEPFTVTVLRGSRVQVTETYIAFQDSDTKVIQDQTRTIDLPPVRVTCDPSAATSILGGDYDANCLDGMEERYGFVGRSRWIPSGIYFVICLGVTGVFMSISDGVGNLRKQKVTKT